MEQWIMPVGIAFGLLLVASLMKTMVGSVFRYMGCVFVAAFAYQAHTAVDEIDFYDPIVLQNLAVLGAIGFGATLLILFAAFRRSRFRFFLTPTIGFGVTYGISSVVIG